MKFFRLVIATVLFSTTAWAQESSEFLLQDAMALGEGWSGFTDVGFMAHALLTLILATVLGGAIAYHPKHGQTADTPEEIESPQIFMMYAVIGAIIGILVVKYGLVVGFVLFGIGGLIRFRTVMRSASLTGRVIYVTLIGLSCGLELPHVAVLATAFGFVLIYVLDAHATYRIDIRALTPEHVAEAASKYRALLEQANSRILSEKKNPRKGRVRFIFQSARRVKRSELESLLESGVDEPLKGTIDWEID
jgi:hypothetical protein